MIMNNQFHPEYLPNPIAKLPLHSQFITSILSWSTATRCWTSNLEHQSFIFATSNHGKRLVEVSQQNEETQ